MNHHHHENMHTHSHNSVSGKEKLGKLFQYWIKHNEDHAKTYLEWSKKKDLERLGDVVSCLEKASQLTLSINKLFIEALKKIS